MSRRLFISLITSLGAISCGTDGEIDLLSRSSDAAGSPDSGAGADSGASSDSGSLPDGGFPDGGPDFLEDFSTYTSSADLNSDPRGIYSTESLRHNVWCGPIALDQTVGYGTSTQSMRYDYLDATNEPYIDENTNHCTNAGHAVFAVLNVTNGRTQAWVEQVFKFDTGFSCGGDHAWGCASAPDFSFILTGVNDPSQGGFNLAMMDIQWTFGYPDHGADWASTNEPLPHLLFDGQWHTIREAVRVSSATNVPDGMAKLWVDGVLLKDYGPVAVNRSSLTTWSLGNTRNQGMKGNHSMWWGRIAIWFTDPGW
jgi:hypothetical protein